MADFTEVLTGTLEVDDSAIEEFEAQFLLSQASMGVIDQFISYKRDIGAKSIELLKYDQIPLNTTPLNEREEVDSTPMVDSAILFTPDSHGDVITTTEVSNITSGGRVNVGASRIVGINAGRVQNKLGLLAMDLSTRILFAGDATGLGDMDAADEVDPLFLEKAFSALGDKETIGMPQAGGEYVAIMHDNVIASLRSGTALGSWQDVSKYTDNMPILKNEVGMFKGFRIIKDNLATIVVGGAGGDGSDAYNSYFMGFNALGKVQSQDTTQVITQNDKLNRFLNIGWKAMVKYGIVENDALVVGKSVKSALAGLV